MFLFVFYRLKTTNAPRFYTSTTIPAQPRVPNNRNFDTATFVLPPSPISSRPRVSAVYVSAACYSFFRSSSKSWLRRLKAEARTGDAFATHDRTCCMISSFFNLKCVCTQHTTPRRDRGEESKNKARFFLCVHLCGETVSRSPSRRLRSLPAATSACPPWPTARCFRGRLRCTPCSTSSPESVACSRPRERR